MPFDWFQTRVFISALMALLHASQSFTPLFGLRRPLRVLCASLWLHAIQYSTSTIAAMNTWKRRTSRFVGTTLLQMALLFEEPFATYVIVVPASHKRHWHAQGILLDSRKFYIGSTTTSVHSRQDARIRKLRLLQQGRFTNTELMVHYFHIHANFYDSLILPFEKYYNKTAVRVAECALIQLWKPQLNMPWIAKLNPTSATRTSVPKLGNTTYQTPGRRLWLRVRRRLRTLGILRLYSSTCLSPLEGWSILVAISQGGLRVFDAERLLRSAQVSDLQCYALFRMSGFLDDPPRSAVKCTLKRCLRFRNLPIPRSAQPLCIPFLAFDVCRQCQDVDPRPHHSV